MTKIHRVDLVYRVQIGDSEREFVLDFNLLDLPEHIASALKRALIAHLGHNAFDTQRKAFQALKLLAQSLRETGKDTKLLLSANVMYDFAEWLNKSPRGSSAQAALNTVKNLLSWCQRNTVDVIDPNATFVVGRIRDASSKARTALEGSVLKLVLRACYKEIEVIESQLKRTREILSGDLALMTADERNLAILMRELLTLGNGKLPPQRLVNRSGNAYARRIEELGGHRAISKLLWLSPDGLVPFYIAILIQTSGNPDAIKNMTRDCITSHPLRTDIERLVWVKPRSSKEQMVDFPIGRKWSAPSIVRRLLALNAEFLDECPISIKNRLFICHNPQARHISVPADDAFLRGLKTFINKYNLPSFQFKDLRKAGAVQHHQAAGTILAAKARLNHSSVQTTVRYTDLSDLADQHDAVIHRFQGEIIRLSTSKTVVKSKEESTQNNKSAGADTIFGFKCKDPLSGISPGSTSGSLCLQFSRCATCPGAIVPVDNPEVIARILGALAALEQARKAALTEGWWPRYERLYEPTRLIIVTELLPAVHASVRELAESKVLRHAVPFLE